MFSIYEEYFLNPLKYPNKYAPYNLVNTLTYAVIAIAIIYLIYKFIKKEKIKIDKNFYYSTLPFVVFGSAIRVAVDAGILPREIIVFGVEVFPLVTPGIYFVVFFTFLFSLLISKRINKKRALDVHRNIGSMLAVLAVISIAVLLKNWLALFGIPALAIIITYLYSKFRKLENVEKTTLFAQSLDGAATFVSVQFFGYGEQHVVANALFGIGGPILFFILKIIVVIAIIEVIKRKIPERDEKIYVLLLITIFGLAPGVRDLLRVASMV